MQKALCLFVAGLFIAGSVNAQDVVENAMRAGPESISADATIQTWDGTVVREGSNDWICLPDRPDTSGDDPWCLTDAWMNFRDITKCCGLGYLEECPDGLFC